MLIGELAKRTGTTAKTLRFYEDEGLLPEPTRTSGGYRDYPAESADRVEFIRGAQQAGSRFGRSVRFSTSGTAGDRHANTSGV